MDVSGLLTCVCSVGNWPPSIKERAGGIASAKRYSSGRGLWYVSDLISCDDRPRGTAHGWSGRPGTKPFIKGVVSACRQLAQRPALLAAGIPSEPVYSSLSRAGGWRCGRSLPLLWRAKWR